MSFENRKTILLVEDEAIIAIGQKNNLEKCGYKIIVAHSGEQAVETAAKTPGINLILMDIDLGKGIDGTEAARIILKDKSLPIVFLSSHTEPEVVEKTELITSYGYVVKNSGITILDASIKMAFRLFDANRTIVESDIKQKAMIAKSSGVITIIDADGTIRFQSPNAEKWFGWLPEDLEGTNCWPLVHHEDLEPLTEELALLLEEDNRVKTMEFSLRCKDGNYKPVEITATNLVNDPVINGVLLNYHDISSRKKAEKAFLENEAQYRLLADNIPDIIYSLDKEGKVLTINNSGFERYGYGKENATGKPFIEFIHPDDRETVINSFLKALEDKRKVTTGLQFRIVAENGESYWFELNARSHFDDNGSYTGEEGVLRDITGRKQAESEIKNLLAEKELLLREVHRRIKNSLNIIRGLIVQQLSAPTEQPVQTLLRSSESRIQRMITLYEKLYCAENFRDLSIREYFKILMEELTEHFPGIGSIEIKTEIEDFKLNVRFISPLGIIAEELLSNILKHAFNGRERGVITISASQRDEHVHIAIQDNGTGMPESVSFENSTGLGLGLVMLLVRQINGSISIDRNDGTRFTLDFPGNTE